MHTFKIQTRGRGGGRAPVVNPRLYIYSHTSARVLVMGVHTSRLRVIPPRPIASLPDPPDREGRSGRARSRGRSIAGGCLSVFLPVVTHERVHAPRPGPTVGPWGRPTRARVRPRARSTTSRVVASRSETTRPRPRSRTHGRARSVHARHVRFVAFDPPSNARSSPLGRTHAHARASVSDKHTTPHRITPERHDRGATRDDDPGPGDDDDDAFAFVARRVRDRARERR